MILESKGSDHLSVRNPNVSFRLCCLRLDLKIWIVFRFLVKSGIMIIVSGTERACRVIMYLHIYSIGSKALVVTIGY